MYHFITGVFRSCLSARDEQTTPSMQINTAVKAKYKCDKLI